MVLGMMKKVLMNIKAVTKRVILIHTIGTILVQQMLPKVSRWTASTSLV